jgi:formamidopyrimidine-DNA glycosylase
MPELPEVECVVRGLRKRIVGETIDRVTIHLPRIVWGSPLELAEHLPGRTFRDVRRRGKLIIIDLDGGFSLLVHLRMTGQLLWLPQDAPQEKHTHLIFHLRSGRHLHYRDQRQFGWIQLAESEHLDEHPQIARLGPEPLEIGRDHLVRRLRKHRRQIKPLLLDQTVLAGLGNIYADESLFRARIHPLSRASRVSVMKLGRLHGAIQEVLRKAIDCSGSTLNHFRDPEGRAGVFQNEHQVYGREEQPCPRCRRPIVKIRVGGRGTHICPRCQRPPRIRFSVRK